MSENNLPFLDEEVAVDAPAPEQVAVEQPAPQGEIEATPPVAQPEETKSIPLTALLDEREKRQQAVREADELRKQIAAMRQPQEAAPKIDIFEDPEGFARQQRDVVQAAIMEDRKARSLWAAEQTHGAEMVEKVIAFFNDPQHAPKSHEFLRHPDPFAMAVKYYQDQQEVAEIRGAGGLAAMRQRLEAEIRGQLMAEVQSGAQVKPASPPPSLASAQAAGSAKAPPASPFDTAFGT